MPADSTTPPAEHATPAPAGERETLETSEWGLEWGDICQIRQRLELTPTERLLAAQALINRVIRIRAKNAGRG